MNDFDDELRRILGDDRLAVPPSADAVGRIVRGARRRRTVRMVASAAGSVGLVAAVAFGSMAVTGQFTAAPTEPQPAESPKLMPVPQLTPDPAAPKTASGDADGDTTGEASPSTADPATEQPTGTDPGGTEQPTGLDEPPPVDVSALPLFDPAAPFDGVQVRMTLAELQQVPGVEITRLRADDLDRPQLCYGAFRTAQTHGYISLRGAIGEPPADLMGGYEVSLVVADVPVRTPAGVGVGSALGDVLTAYSDAGVDGDVVTAGVPDLGGVFSLWSFQLDGNTVTSVSHDGIPNCGDAPVPAPAPVTADFAVPGGDVFGPVRLGMTLAELRATPGVEITEWSGRSRPYCYGEFRVGDVTGMVSLLRDISTGELPAPAVSEDEFVVSAIGTTAGGTTTPAGVGVGSTLDQVAAAQPGFSTEVPGSALPGAPATQGVRWTFEQWDGDVVQRLGLDAGHSCVG